MRLIVIGIMCLLLLIVGCGGNSEITGGKGKSFIGGTDSIEFEFLEETPPREVFDSGEHPFEVIVSLENEGEFDVAKEDIEVRLSGFYAPDFNNPPVKLNPEENLDKSFVDSDGEVDQGTITYVTFPGFNYVSKLLGSNEFTIRVEICYKYGTRAQADICVLDDLTSNEDEECETSEGKSVASSSGPVQIENVDEEVAGSRKLKVAFDIVHRENGLISKLGNSCSTDTAVKNKVWVEVNTGFGVLDCSGLDEGSGNIGFTTLYNGKRKIVCTIDVSGETGDFEKKMEILVQYDYKEHKETNVLVKHSAD